MNRQSQRGIALVITLVMLSVVTFMAVVFLAISRRERASVSASADFADAHLMADAALERAKSEVLSRILATTNVGAYDLIISTNLVNPRGFIAGNASLTNVSYWLAPNPAINPPAALKPNLNKANRIQNIANLQYDARPPVFIRTNFVMSASDPRAWDFRFFLDLNRNGLFEDTGAFLDAETRQGTALSGDPQW